MDDKWDFGPLHLSNPLSVLPTRLQRSQISRIENVFGRGNKPAALHIIPGVTGTNGHELQHARITVAVNHASRAAIADELGLIELVNAAHRLLPKMAAVQVQVPIQVKIFMPAQA